LPKIECTGKKEAIVSCAAEKGDVNLIAVVCDKMDLDVPVFINDFGEFATR
jgi:hypothetical protein